MQKLQKSITRDNKYNLRRADYKMDIFTRLINLIY